jgi:hypothetical protein
MHVLTSFTSFTAATLLRDGNRWTHDRYMPYVSIRQHSSAYVSIRHADSVTCEAQNLACIPALLTKARK